MTEIVQTEGVLGGDPRIAGTRIGVLHVYELAQNHSPADVADQLDLSLADVHAALSYYYAHPDEMRMVKARHVEAEERLASRALKPPERVT